MELSARQHPAEADHNRNLHLASAIAASAHPPGNRLGGSQASPIPAPHPLLPHGYNHTQIPQNEAHLHPDLRSSHEQANSSGYPPIPNMMPLGVPPPPDQQGVMSGPPVGGGEAAVPGVAVVTDDTADGRKTKRELSQSKRAAQNRAAQRAFRQRKEGYIKKLEQQVRDYAEMENSFKAMQAEYYQLREYVLTLQSRLLETEGDYPHPPANINLAHAHGGGQPAPQPTMHVPESAPPANAGAGDGTQLEVVAQAVAVATEREQYPGKAFKTGQVYKTEPHADEDARAAEEITRQLQAEGGTEGVPRAPM